MTLAERIRKGDLTKPQLHRLRWLRAARRNQIVPTDLVARGYNGWVALPGRGWGKTRAGSEHSWWCGYRQPLRISVVAPTFAVGRDLCIEGESGIQAFMPRELEQQWNRSTGELYLTNGTIIKLFSGDEPDRLRGYQSHLVWFEELAAFKYPQEAFDMAMLGLRLGDDPHFVVTSTPKPVKLIRELAREREDVLLVEGHTRENEGNLSRVFMRQIERYAGTRLGLQEIEGRILEDTPGALWTSAGIEATRVRSAPETLDKLVVAIDPYGGSASGECGIVAAGNEVRYVDGDWTEAHTYVLEDLSGQFTPEQWARRAVEAFYRLRADAIVAEVNYGGAMVEATIRAVDKNVPVRLVTATRGKAVRAEPISARYAQGKVHHVGAFADLESQMTTWVPGDKSPDRMDAMVWACTDLGDGGGFDMD